jgi:hypothetical protein
MKTWKCYQCSYCCTQSACGYGKWNPKKHQCDYLNKNGSCSKYSEIVEHEKDSPMAMMGCGCSSPLLNEMRVAKMIALGINPEDEQKEIEKDLGIELDFSPDFDKLWEKIEEIK